jgi:putative two-component system response regulator
MRNYSQVLAEELQQHSPYARQIDQQFLADLYRSSPLHDIGKVGIRDDILLKPGRLTSEEFAIMQQHSVIGANILDQAVLGSQDGGFLAVAALIARFHHEHFDGSGYPAGLVGNEIPLPARIVAVADVYDALTSVRPYKPAYTPEHARRIIVSESARHFDPVIVDAFQSRFDEFLRTQEEQAESFPLSRGVMAFCQNEILSALDPLEVGAGIESTGSGDGL